MGIGSFSVEPVGVRNERLVSSRAGLSRGAQSGNWFAVFRRASASRSNEWRVRRYSECTDRFFPTCLNPRGEYLQRWLRKQGLLPIVSVSGIVYDNRERRPFIICSDGEGLAHYVRVEYVGMLEEARLIRECVSAVACYSAGRDLLAMGASCSTFSYLRCALQRSDGRPLLYLCRGVRPMVANV